VTKFDNQSAHPSFSASFMADRLKDSVYGELTDSSAKAKMQSSAVLTGSQNIRNLALQSIIEEFQQNFTGEQEDSETLVGKHFRKQNELAQNAVDDFHSYLVACD
jgi:hypothetical protein